MSLTDCTLPKLCGNEFTGVPGCTNRLTTYLEFEIGQGTQCATVLCDEHAIGLRSNQDVWGLASSECDEWPYTVTHYCSITSGCMHESASRPS